MKALEPVLQAAGIRLRESKHPLKTQARKWRHYFRGLWYRHQDQPAVAALHQSNLLVAGRGEVLLKSGPKRLDEYAAHLKQEHQMAVA